jgi:hypothetical protein
MKKKFKKDLQDKGKGLYLCPPKPKGMALIVKLKKTRQAGLFKTSKEEKKINEFFLKKACEFKKKLYFCSRLPGQSLRQ